jgi:hypothetical protein
MFYVIWGSNIPLLLVEELLLLMLSRIYLVTAVENTLRDITVMSHLSSRRHTLHCCLQVKGRLRSGIEQGSVPSPRLISYMSPDERLDER